MYKCEICNREFSVLSGLGVHISRTHNMTSHDYYDKYIKRPDEGKCLYCGKDTEYNKWSYKNYCNRSCQFKYNEEKMLHTMQEKYGVKYAAQSSTSRQKMENTCLEKYNVKYGFHTEEAKQKAANSITEESKKLRLVHMKETNLKKYGNICSFNTEQGKLNSHSEEANQKRKQTSLQRYGTEYPMQSEEIKNKVKQTNLEKYEVENTYQLDKVNNLKNSSISRRKAKLTIKSKKVIDNSAETFLENALKENDIRFETEYRSKVYPFNCDFYLIDFDIYLEVNIHPTHNYHFFDSNNLEDLNQLDVLKEKAKNSDWYKKVIEVWTVRDVEKFKYAKENNLRYLVIWSYDDLNKFICNLNNYIKNNFKGVV